MLLLLQNHSTSIHSQQQYTLLYGMVWLLIRFKSMLIQPVKFNSQNYYFSFLLDYTLDHEFIRICTTWSEGNLFSALECECGFMFSLSRYLCLCFHHAYSVYALLLKGIALCRNFSSSKKWIKNKNEIVIAEIKIRRLVFFT